jgi:hypothetical protein
VSLSRLGKAFLVCLGNSFYSSISTVLASGSVHAQVVARKRHVNPPSIMWMSFRETGELLWYQLLDSYADSGSYLVDAVRFLCGYAVAHYDEPRTNPS